MSHMLIERRIDLPQRKADQVALGEALREIAREIALAAGFESVTALSQHYLSYIAEAQTMPGTWDTASKETAGKALNTALTVQSAATAIDTVYRPGVCLVMWDLACYCLRQLNRHHPGAYWPLHDLVSIMEPYTVDIMAT